MLEPRTEAGRALLDEFWPERDDEVGLRGPIASRMILAIEAEAAAGPPDLTAARQKLALILHQRESAGQQRCGPNSRGCRMRHDMDASSILMELGLEDA